MGVLFTFTLVFIACFVLFANPFGCHGGFYAWHMRSSNEHALRERNEKNLTLQIWDCDPKNKDLFHVYWVNPLEHKCPAPFSRAARYHRHEFVSSHDSL